MRPSGFLLVAALLVLLQTPGIAAAAPAAPLAELPPDVRGGVEEFTKSCEGKKTFASGFVTRRDVNGDGVVDYIVDYGKFACGDTTTFFCGSGGCSVQVFASVFGRQYALALDELVRDIRFETVRGRPAAILSLHGSACGRVGASTCRKTLVWTGGAFSEPQRRR